MWAERYKKQSPRPQSHMSQQNPWFPIEFSHLYSKKIHTFNATLSPHLQRCLVGHAAGFAAALAVDGSASPGALGDGPGASTSLAALGSLLQVVRTELPVMGSLVSDL